MKCKWVLRCSFFSRAFSLLRATGLKSPNMPN